MITGSSQSETAFTHYTLVYRIFLDCLFVGMPVFALTCSCELWGCWKEPWQQHLTAQHCLSCWWQNITQWHQRAHCWHCVSTEEARVYCKSYQTCLGVLRKLLSPPFQWLKQEHPFNNKQPKVFNYHMFCKCSYLYLSHYFPTQFPQYSHFEYY